MNKLLTALLVLAVTGCATNTHKAATQNYRLKGAENTTTINGALLHDYKIASDEYAVGIYIDETMHIKFPLDSQLNGEGTGLDYQGKKTSATCTGRKVSASTTEVRCMVFIDNERTVTLTF